MPIDDILGLAGRVALVTGAASGYGRATAELLAKFGAHVVACDINEPGLDALIANLERPADHLPLRADISDVSQCERLVASTLKRYQRMDILVNAAAVLQPANIEEVDEQLWNRTLDVNLKSQYFLSPATLRTPLFRRGMSDAELAAVSDNYLSSCLFGRWTRPDEVAMSVIYLASAMSSCVTGHVLRADSGAGVLHP